MVKFMIHDQWREVLFLHWRFPTDAALGRLLAKSTPYALDVFEGAFWVGLVLLTEDNIGPGFWRQSLLAPFVVTHHGVNVRTYVENDGIFFFSLECDSLIATFGANVAAGIPYKVANMERTTLRFCGVSPGDNQATAATGGNKRMAVAPKGMGPVSYVLQSERLSKVRWTLWAKLKQVLLCRRSVGMMPSSTRLEEGESLLNHEQLLASRKPHSQLGCLHSERIVDVPCTGTSLSIPEERSLLLTRWPSPSGANPTGDRASQPCNTTASGEGQQQQFCVRCAWSPLEQESGVSAVVDAPRPDNRNDSVEDAEKSWRRRAEFFVERYFVYTSRRCRGRVTHPKWPVQHATVHNLELDWRAYCSGHEVSTPGASDRASGASSRFRSPMAAVLKHMAETPADHVCFSPGVGPVEFDFLQPLSWCSPRRGGVGDDKACTFGEKKSA
jgi:hypothetical protein